MITDKKTAVRLLKRARGLIAGNNDRFNSLRRFICLALGLAARPGHESEVSEEVRSLITQRLEGEVTLEAWLSKVRHYNLGAEKTGYSYFLKGKAARLAWIDSLIEEFKHG